VAVRTELEGGERDVGDVDLALGRPAVAVEDPHAGATHARHVAFLEVDHAARRAQDRRHVGGDEVLALAQPDEQRAADAAQAKLSGEAADTTAIAYAPTRSRTARCVRREGRVSRGNNDG